MAKLNSGTRIYGNVTVDTFVTATGNVTGGNITTAGAISTTGNAIVGNILTNGYYYANGVVFGGGGGGTPGGSNTQVQFNDNGTFGGNGQFVYNKVTNIVTAGAFAGNTNGTGQNFQVGDDAWIGDINTADTIGLKGQQNPANCYIVFGNSDATGKLGRAGTGPLTYAGAFSATGNITGGNLSGTSIVGTLTTAAQTNITSVGTLTSLSVTGNVTGGNLVTAGLISATGNVSGGNLNVTGNIVDSGALSIITGASGNVNLAPNGTNVLVATTTGANITGTLDATGNITGGNLSATTVVATTLTGTLSTAAQTNITSVGTLGSLSVTGNITGGNITTAGNLAIPTATANTNTTQAATTAFVVGQAGALTPVTIGTAAVGTSLRYAREDHTHGGVGSAVAGTGISVSAATGAVTFTNSGVTSAVAGTNIAVSGATGAVTISVTGTVPTATTAATVTTAAQPNITSVGTLTSLAVTGNITGGNLSGTSIVGTLTTAAQTNITSVGTLGALTVTGNVGGGNFVGTLNGSGANVTSISATNISSGTLAQARLANTAVTLGSTALTLGSTVTTVAGLTSVTSTTFVGALTGAATTAATVTTAAQPNITSVGTLTGLTINNATTAITNGAATGTGNIGASGATFNTIFAKATSAQYADLAEMYQGDQSYVPGTVVEFGGTQEVTITTTESSTRIAGVVSTNPSYLMNSGLTTLNSVPVALTGRVPCQVLGPVRKGDRLVSSVLPGVAQPLDETTYRPGCMIGKSLEDWSESTVKLIEVVVGRL